MTEAPSDLDLDAYLARIRWSGEVRHDLPTLTRLLQGHMVSIPFENLDVLMGRPIRLDLPGVQDKLVRQRRGGYCFEHVTLFAAVLEALGFAPVRHLARVTLRAPPSRAGRTHMFVTVPLDDDAAEGGVQRYVLDPGFGAQAARLPLPLRSGGSDPPASQGEGDETHAMAQQPDGRGWVMRVRTGSLQPQLPSDAWTSPLEQEHAVDFELGNHYTASHRDSPFVQHLMLRALTPQGRVTVIDRHATLWRLGQPPERHLLADRAALRALLADHFGIDLPAVLQLRVPSIPEWT